MKMTLRNLLGITVVIMTSVVLFSFVAPQDQKAGAAWNIPANYKSMANPQKGKGDPENVGKMLYAKHCKSCHGGTVLGDGPKTAEFQGQSDGVIYYQSFVGRDEMPNFEKKSLDESDRWFIVNYMRTLK